MSAMTGSSPWRGLFYGTDTPMPTAKGLIPRSFLNNAAMPQIAKPVIRDFLDRLDCYAYDNEANAISRELQAAYNEVREVALRFIGGDPEQETVVFTPTTTTAINLLSHIMLQADPDQVILTTRMEHMANYLPWRERFKTALVGVTPCGDVDMEDYLKS